MNRNQIQEIATRLTKLDITGGDVLVLTAREGMDREKVNQVFQMAFEEYKKRGLEPPVFTILAPGQTLETLNEDKMRDHGWVRAQCPSCLTQGAE